MPLRIFSEQTLAPREDGFVNWQRKAYTDASETADVFVPVFWSGSGLIASLLLLPSLTGAIPDGDALNLLIALLG